MLIVEDDADVRESLEYLLESEGFRCHSVRDGRRALSYLESNPAPAVILLDLMLPSMNGWQLRSALQQRADLAEIPVLLLSGVGDLHNQAQALGVDGYLRKPLEPRLLIEVVRGYCS